MLESEVVRVREQNSQQANETSQLNNTIAELRDQVAFAEQDIALLKQEAVQLQEDYRNKTCASLILIFKNVIIVPKYIGLLLSYTLLDMT